MVFFFFCCSRLTVSGCRTGLGREDLCVCVQIHKVPRESWGWCRVQGAEALSGRWLVLSPRQESFWRAEPAQAREGRGRKEPEASGSCCMLPPEGPGALTGHLTEQGLLRVGTRVTLPIAVRHRFG